MSKKKKDDEGNIWVGGQRIYPDPTKRESSDSDDDWLSQDYGFGSFRKPKSRIVEEKKEDKD